MKMRNSKHKTRNGLRFPIFVSHWSEVNASPDIRISDLRMLLNEGEEKNG